MLDENVEYCCCAACETACETLNNVAMKRSSDATKKLSCFKLNYTPGRSGCPNLAEAAVLSLCAVQHDTKTQV